MSKKSRILTMSATLAVFMVSVLVSAQGPYDPESWPPTVDPNAVVHYTSVDYAFAPPGGSWLEEELQILSGGDQITEPITIGGHDGLKATAAHINVRDYSFETWADHDTIDILVQVYGNAAVLGSDGNPRDFSFLEGTLPPEYLTAPVGGSIPVDCKNSKWNWYLFRITNDIRPDGARYVGSIPEGAQGAYAFGGVNDGTIRFQDVPNLIVRVVAFGEQGAFGEPEDINVCAPPDECPPEPETNLVWADIDSDTADHLEVINNGDQTVEFVDNIGPADDKRRAVRALGVLMNFGITSNYLGEACSEPHPVKICLEYYDDPALAGARFGPEAYATDDKGGIAFYPQSGWETLQGSDQWIRRSWVVPDVSLYGVNAAPTWTAGPRLHFEGGSVAISRVDIAVLREGDHPLAGQDPLSDCYADPRICTDEYGNYAEMDLQAGVTNGLTVGTSGGDQEMIVEEAGPVGDRRLAVRPAFDDGSPGFAHNFINLSIIDEPFGPTSQPNARLGICVTYYDDPNLVGATFRPEVYKREEAGVENFAFTDPGIAWSIEGTDQWREAYFEIPEIKFSGVNQGPQAAARFFLSDKIYFTRVRYCVIRPCGPNEGVNLLEECQRSSIVDRGLQILTFNRSGTRLGLSFPTIGGAQYQVEAAPEPEPEVWLPIPFATAADGPLDQTSLTGNGLTTGIFVEPNPADIGAQFYRVVAP